MFHATVGATMIPLPLVNSATPIRLQLLPLANRTTVNPPRKEAPARKAQQRSELAILPIMGRSRDEVEGNSWVQEEEAVAHPLVKAAGAQEINEIIEAVAIDRPAIAAHQGRLHLHNLHQQQPHRDHPEAEISMPRCLGDIAMMRTNPTLAFHDLAVSVPDDQTVIIMEDPIQDHRDEAKILPAQENPIEQKKDLGDGKNQRKRRTTSRSK